jgi:hypothetical protein
MERERIFGILAKIETTSGTDSVPVAGTDAVRAVGIPTLNMSYLEQGDRPDAQTGALITADRSSAAGRFGEIDVTLEVKGGGSGGATPEADVFIRGCGMSKTVVGGTSVTYTTIDDAMETFTMYCYTGRKLIKMVGCVATMKLNGEAAKRGFMTFSVTGKIASDPTQVTTPTLTLNAVIPPLFHSASATIGAWTSADADPLVLKKASVDLANVRSPRPSAGATDGLIGFAITDRRTAQQQTLEVPALTTFDIFALSKAAGDTMPVSTWQIGTAIGNRLKVQTGRWSLKAPKFGADNAITTYDLDGSLGPGATGATTRELVLLYD